MIYHLRNWQVLFSLGSIVCIGGLATYPIAIALSDESSTTPDTSTKSTSNEPMADSIQPSFRARTDEWAQQDTDLLRERIKLMLDSKRTVNPMADYEQRGSKGSIDIQSDDPEANVVPRLGSGSASAPSSNTPNSSKSIGKLPPPRYSNDRDLARNRLVASMPQDGFRPVSATTMADAEAKIKPALSSVPFSSTNNGVVINDGSVLPATYYGTPVIVNYQGFDGAVLPNNPGPAYNPSSVPGYPQGSVIPTNPSSGLSNPYGNQPNMGTTINPNAVPNYPRNSGVVNGAPFVSAPPCQFDARYMVSPTVYRQSNECLSPGGYASGPYSGSPFAYAPYAAMPTGARMIRPLFGLGQSLAGASIGRGFYGQPKAYIQGQSVRNFLRYLTP